MNLALVAISALTTGFLLAYIALATPSNPIILIIGMCLCAVPMIRALVLTGLRRMGYPH
jgi:hypothetical protein